MKRMLKYIGICLGLMLLVELWQSDILTVKHVQKAVVEAKVLRSIMMGGMPPSRPFNSESKLFKTGDTHINITTRSKFQMSQVEKFCQKYNLSDTGPATAASHLLVNKASRALFCYVPKSGCTNLKTVFLLSQGKLHQLVSTIEQKQDQPGIPISDYQISDAVYRISMERLTQTERQEALQHYFKFIMYRNPLERLVSAYKDKLAQYPLDRSFRHFFRWLFDSTHPYHWLQEAIYQHAHPKEYEAWKASKGESKIHILFQDFLEYWLLHNRKMDEHFKLIFDLCSPCRVGYDYYGNFNNYTQDSKVLLDRINVSESYLPHGYHNTINHTATITKALYDQVTVATKEHLLRKLSRELDFYYHIFPEERDCHKRILNTESELEVPSGHG